MTPLTLGTRLGPYEVPATIGAGGMGAVYRARYARDDAFKSATDLNFRTPGGNFRGLRRRPNSRTDLIARTSSGDPAGRHASLFISSALRNFVTGI